MESLNERTIREVLSRLPKNIKPVGYLMDSLRLGKESAYRRLNSQIPFTFEEVVTMANDLEFSIDALTRNNKKERVFFDLVSDIEKKPSSDVIDMFKNNIRTLKELNDAKTVNVIATINHIPIHFFPFDTLFKFSYCSYLHSNGDIPLSFKFSDITIPSEIKELQKESVYYFNRIKNVTCITDSIIFEKIIKKIQYYYRLNFISEEETGILQQELFKLLDFIERLIRTGCNDFGSNYAIYYSHFNIDSNCIYLEYDDKVMSQIWLYLENPIIIRNSLQMCKIQKKWIDTTIKYSELISKSNDMLQSEVIRNLSNQISKLKDCSRQIN
jgi:hypothetical protein